MEAQVRLVAELWNPTGMVLPCLLALNTPGKLDDQRPSQHERAAKGRVQKLKDAVALSG